MSDARQAASIPAIDVHAHYGPYLNSNELRNRFMTAGVDFVLERAREARTELSVVSPLAAMMPRGGGEPVAANRDAARIVAETDGLLQWVVIDPRKPDTFEQADEMLQLPKCVGIKIHPEEHLYAVAEHGRPIFELAARHGTVVISHSGEQNSLPADLQRLADDFPEVSVILAHLGCGWDNDLTYQVRAIQASRHGNVFVDTSSGSSLVPRFIEWAVEQVGPERLLYGSDIPCNDSPMQRARINHAGIDEKAKRMILRENAVNLLKLG